MDINRAEYLNGFHEYSCVKKHTCVPKLMKEAYSLPIDKGQALAIIVILHEEWGDSLSVPSRYRLGNRFPKIIWNRKNGNARGGYYRMNDMITMRPFLKLPEKRLTVGLLLHEYAHVITIYHEIANRKRRIPKHGPIFRGTFDYLLMNHKEDYLKVAKISLDILAEV